MKKVNFFLLGLLLMLVATGLRAAPANVNFASERGVPFQLVFDGRPLTRGATQVHIDRLMPGYHVAEFAVPSGYGRSVSFRTRVFLDPGLETSFVLITRNGYPPALRKVAAVPLRRPYEPVYGNYPPGPGSYDPGRDCDNAGSTSYPDRDYGRGSNGDYSSTRGGYSTTPGYDDYNVLSARDADALVEAVNRQSFDREKLPLAKQALGETAIQADDLKRLLATLTFDQSRVELAKYAYPRVADRHNFYQVYEAFDFQSGSGVRELQQFVADQQRR